MANDADEIVKLRERFETHLEEHRLDAVEYAERQARQDAAHEKNMEAIANLTESTQRVVDAWNVGLGIGKLIKWAASFIPLVLFLLWVVSKLPADFFKIS